MGRASKIQLNAPAGGLPSLMAAVDAGADSVYIGFRSPTNLRNLPGLNFSLQDATEGVQYAHQRGAKVYVTVNTHPLDHQVEECFRAVDDVNNIRADAVIAADLALHLPDFRAAERTFQLLTQVAGRAGRGKVPGRVIVQTFAPDHSAISPSGETAIPSASAMPLIPPHRPSGRPSRFSRSMEVPSRPTM